MSGEFVSRKDSQSTKFEQRPRIFVKLSFRELCDSKLSGLHASDSILPNISVIFADNGDFQLNFHEKCREKAAYIYGTLQVHFVKRLMSDMKYKLKF